MVRTAHVMVWSATTTSKLTLASSRLSATVLANMSYLQIRPMSNDAYLTVYIDPEAMLNRWDNE